MATEATETPTASAEAGAWVEAFIEGWRAPSGPDAFADHFEPLLDPGVRLVQPQLPTTLGREEFRERFVRPLFELVRDLRGTVEGWAADGDVIYIDIRIEGRVGRRPVALRSIDRVTLRDGRAVERVARLDPTPLLAAVARSPSAWPRFARQQLRTLRARRS